MKVTTPQHFDDTGQDSFLDIVANMVGILIMLVMVVGLRVEHSTKEAAEAEPDPHVAELSQLEHESAELEKHVREIAVRISEVDELIKARFQQRSMLAYLVAEREHKLEEDGQSLDEQEKEEFQRRQTLSAAKTQLASLTRQLQSAQTIAAGAAIEIKTYPTPISKTVHGREAHFQLRGGQVTYIPMEQLVEAFKRDAQQKVYKLHELPEFTETVGPIGGFRLRYTLERVEVRVDDRGGEGPRVGSFARLRQYTLIPVSGQLGEPLADSLQEGSNMRSTLAGFDPKRTTVTLWTYPDSFATYRELKKRLYETGFEVAGRPLPEDQPIGGSPEGSKSAAQ